MKLNNRGFVGLAVLGGVAAIILWMIWVPLPRNQKDCGVVETAEDAGQALCFMTALSECKAASVQVLIGEKMQLEVLPDCRVRVISLEGNADVCPYSAGTYKDCHLGKDIGSGLEIAKLNAQVSIMLLPQFRELEECEGELWAADLRCFNPVEYVAQFGKTIEDCFIYKFNFKSDTDFCVRRMSQFRDQPTMCDQSVDPNECYFEFVRLVKQGFTQSTQDLQDICQKITDTKQAEECTTKLNR